MNKNYIKKKLRVVTKILVQVSALFVIFILTSCATTMTQSQIVSADYVPSEKSGYIYGLFSLHTEEDGFAIGLVVQNLDNSQKYNFILDSRPGKEIQLVAVPQGNYRVDSIEYINPKNKVDAILDFALPPEQYQRNFVVELDTAIYIGNYYGLAKNSPETKEVFWSMQVPVNKYEETTVGLQEKYLFLNDADIAFVSNMIEEQIPSN